MNESLDADAVQKISGVESDESVARVPVVGKVYLAAGCDPRACGVAGPMRVQRAMATLQSAGESWQPIPATLVCW